MQFGLLLLFQLFVQRCFAGLALRVMLLICMLAAVLRAASLLLVAAVSLGQGEFALRSRLVRFFCQLDWLLVAFVDLPVLYLSVGSLCL